MSARAQAPRAGRLELLLLCGRVLSETDVTRPGRWGERNLGRTVTSMPSSAFTKPSRLESASLLLDRPMRRAHISLC